MHFVIFDRNGAESGEEGWTDAVVTEYKNTNFIVECSSGPSEKTTRTYSLKEIRNALVENNKAVILGHALVGGKHIRVRVNGCF